MTGRAEFDPLGADVSVTAPPDPPPSEGDGDVGAGHFGGLLDARWSDFFNTSSGCMIDHKMAMCSEAMLYVNAGAGEQCPNNVCTTLTVKHGALVRNYFQSFADGFSGGLCRNPNA
jgi:hypothetical protein